MMENQKLSMILSLKKSSKSVLQDVPLIHVFRKILKDTDEESLFPVKYLKIQSKQFFCHFVSNFRMYFPRIQNYVLKSGKILSQCPRKH